jgi:hypothetical protein
MEKYKPSFAWFTVDEQKIINKTEYTKNSIKCYNKNNILVYFEVKNGDKIEWEKSVFKNDYLILREYNDYLILKEERDGENLKRDLEFKIFNNSKNEWKTLFYKEGEMLNWHSAPVCEINHTWYYVINDWKPWKNANDNFIRKIVLQDNLVVWSHRR